MTQAWTNPFVLLPAVNVGMDFNDLEHLHQTNELQIHLAQNGHPEACASPISCDPWIYEPILLQEIKDARKQNDAQACNHLRGLMRAASWQTYERLDEETPWQILQSLRSAQMPLHLIEQLEQTLRDKRTGPDVEQSLQSIEDINQRAWLDLKRVLAPHGYTPKQAITNHFAAAEIKHLEEIRKLRDLLIYRRIYPNWAKRSLDDTRETLIDRRSNPATR